MWFASKSKDERFSMASQAWLSVSLPISPLHHPPSSLIFTPHPPIPMTRMRYEGAYARVMPWCWLLVIPGFAYFGAGAYLENSRGIAWATDIAGVSAVLIFGFLGV